MTVLWNRVYDIESQAWSKLKSFFKLFLINLECISSTMWTMRKMREKLRELYCCYFPPSALTASCIMQPNNNNNNSQKNFTNQSKKLYSLAFDILRR